MEDLIVESGDLDWTPYEIPGATPGGFSIKPLNMALANEAITMLLRMEPGATLPRHLHARTTEIDHILEGDFVYGGRVHGPGSFFARGAGVVHGPLQTENGCTLLLIMTNEADAAAQVGKVDLEYVD